MYGLFLWPALAFGPIQERDWRRLRFGFGFETQLLVHHSTCQTVTKLHTNLVKITKLRILSKSPRHESGQNHQVTNLVKIIKSRIWSKSSSHESGQNHKVTNLVKITKQTGQKKSGSKHMSLTFFEKTCWPSSWFIIFTQKKSRIRRSCPSFEVCCCGHVERICTGYRHRHPIRTRSRLNANMQ
jgi:hypothetical protein